MYSTLLHSERPKLYEVLAILSAIGLMDTIFSPAAGIKVHDVTCLGISTQRNTCLTWDR